MADLFGLFRFRGLVTTGTVTPWHGHCRPCRSVATEVTSGSMTAIRGMQWRGGRADGSDNILSRHRMESGLGAISASRLGAGRSVGLDGPSRRGQRPLSRPNPRFHKEPRQRQPYFFVHSVSKARSLRLLASGLRSCIAVPVSLVDPWRLWGREHVRWNLRDRLSRRTHRERLLSTDRRRMSRCQRHGRGRLPVSALVLCQWSQWSLRGPSLAGDPTLCFDQFLDSTRTGSPCHQRLFGRWSALDGDRDQAARFFRYRGVHRGAAECPPLELSGQVFCRFRPRHVPLADAVQSPPKGGALLWWAHSFTREVFRRTSLWRGSGRPGAGDPEQPRGTARAGGFATRRARNLPGLGRQGQL